MTARLPNDEEKAICRVFTQASALLSNNSPLREQFNKAAVTRICAKPGVPDEAELLEKARRVIEAAS